MQLETCGTLHVSEKDFADWLKEDGRKALVYAVGDLAYSRQKGSEKKAAALNAVADAALYASGYRLERVPCMRLKEWCCSGPQYVCLTQRRLAKNVFAYIATKRGRR